MCLGTIAPDKSRQLKLKLISEDDKKNVMLKLPNVKTAEDRFKNASITDDYMVEERRLGNTYKNESCQRVS